MTNPKTPKRWSVFVTVDANFYVEVEAANAEEAKLKAMDVASSPCICHRCSDLIELGDPMEALEATEIDDE